MDPVLFETFMHYKCLVLMRANGRNIHNLKNKLCIISAGLQSYDTHSEMVDKATQFIFNETWIYISWKEELCRPKSS